MLARQAAPTWGKPRPGWSRRSLRRELSPSQTAMDYAGTFSPDGTRILLYARDWQSKVKTFMKRTWSMGSGQTPPRFLLPPEYDAFEPHVTLDNKTLYFGWFHPCQPEKKAPKDLAFGRRIAPPMVGQSRDMSARACLSVPIRADKSMSPIRTPAV